MTKKLSKHLVLYIDILGIKDKMLNNESEIYLNIITFFWDYMNSWKKDVIEILAAKKVFFKVFSDNICVAIPVSENENNITELCYSILTFAQIIYKSAIDKKLLVRGGIAYGDLYIDENMVYGEALINAYILESKIAKYPRIVISNDFIKLLHNEYNEEYELDFDNLYCIKFLNHINNVQTERESIYKFLSKEIDKNTSNLDVQQKYSWVLNKLRKGQKND
mgnify:CR=1 FL=1